MVAIETLAPRSIPCDEDVDCDPSVSIEVLVKANQPDGTQAHVPMALPVDGDLVRKTNELFAEQAPVVLRKIQDSLLQGLKQPDKDIKKACAAVAPSVKANVPYKMLPNVKIPLNVESKVGQIGKRFFQNTKTPIVVTSGNRDSVSQANAIRNKISLGDNVTKLYGNKRAIGQVVWAYKQAKHQGQGKAGVTDAMASVIEDQVSQGIFLSNHLRNGAVDLRSRDLSAWKKKELRAAAATVPGVRVLEETTPPHFHLDVQ